jgi:hypothetical protein
LVAGSKGDNLRACGRSQVILSRAVLFKQIWLCKLCSVNVMKSVRIGFLLDWIHDDLKDVPELSVWKHSGSEDKDKSDKGTSTRIDWKVR